MQSRVFGVIFFPPHCSLVSSAAHATFWGSVVAVHTSPFTIPTPRSCHYSAHLSWSSDQFPCLQPLLIPIIPSVIWTPNLVFLSQLLTLIQCSPCSRHTELTDFTPILLVHFFCGLHIMFPLHLLFSVAAASLSFQMLLKCYLLGMLSLK